MRFTGIDFSPTAMRLPSAPGTGMCGSSAGWQLRAATIRRSGEQAQLTWQRIASGLFQPLGLKIVDGADLRHLPRSDRASCTI